MLVESSNSSRIRHRRFVAFALGLFLFSVYLFVYRGGFHSVDEVSMFAVTESLVKFGQVDTDQIAWTQWATNQAEAQGFFGHDGHVYSKKGLALSLVQAPLYAGALWIPNLGMLQTVSLLNSIITAATAVIVFMFSWRMGFSGIVSLSTSLVFGLATIALVYAKYLFSEPLAGLFLLLAAYMLFAFRQEGGNRHVVIAGVVAASAVMTRANNLFLLPLYLLYLFWAEYQHFECKKNSKNFTGQSIPNFIFCLAQPAALKTTVAFIVALAVPTIVLLAYNLIRSGNPFQTGYDLTLFSANLPLGFYKLLFSPLRGFFIYSPILLLSLPGWWWLRQRFPAESLLFLGITGVTLVLFAAWSSGEGLSWGSRFLVPVVPFFAICLAPVIEKVVASDSRLPQKGNRGLMIIFFVLLVVSFLIQVLGATINPWAYLAKLQADLGGEFFLENTSALNDFSTSQISGQVSMFSIENSDLVWWQAWGFDGLAFSLSLSLVIFSAGLLGLSLTSRRLYASNTILAVLIFFAVLIVIIFSTILLLRYANSDQQFGANDDGYSQALNVIATSTPGEPIVTVAQYHYHVPMNRFKFRSPLIGFSQLAWPPPETAIFLLDSTLTGDHTWLVTVGLPPAAGDNAVERWLAENSFKIGDEWLRDSVRSVHFTALEPTTTEPADVTFGDEIRLTDVQLRTVVAPGQPIPVRFQFEALAPPASDYNLFLQLLSSGGTPIAQHDGPPVGGYAPTTTWTRGQNIISRHAVWPPATTPAGDYRLIAGLVDPQSGQRLPASTGGDFVDLGNVAIIR